MVNGVGGRVRFNQVCTNTGEVRFLAPPILSGRGDVTTSAGNGWSDFMDDALTSQKTP
jgi:hypothetical protein